MSIFDDLNPFKQVERAYNGMLNGDPTEIIKGGLDPIGNQIVGTNPGGSQSGTSLGDVLTDADKNMNPPKPPDPNEITKNLENARRGKGRSADLLTGGQGLLDEPMTARRYLLGA